jgi:hypothetical protein
MVNFKKILRRHVATESAAPNWEVMQHRNFERDLADSIACYLDGVLDEYPPEYIGALIKSEDLELSYLADTTKRLMLLLMSIAKSLDIQSTL